MRDVASMGANRFAITGTLTLLLWFGGSMARAANNPNGWIQTRGWNMLLPLLNPAACSGGGANEMKRNWVAPHVVGTEDPSAGDEWENIDFGSTAAAAGFDIGGLASDPIWFTTAFLEAAFAFPPNSFPNGDVV